MQCVGSSCLLICIWDTTKEHDSEVLQSICYDEPILDPEWSFNNFLSEPLRAGFAVQEGKPETSDPSCCFKSCLGQGSRGEGVSVRSCAVPADPGLSFPPQPRARWEELPGSQRGTHCV